MNRRGFLRSLIAGAGAIAAARVLPAPAAQEELVPYWQSVAVDVVKSTSTNFDALWRNESGEACNR